MAKAVSPAAALVPPGQVPLVYLDANILLPQYLRSVFLDLADAGLIRVYWSEQVLEEMRRNLVKPAFGKTARQGGNLLRTIGQAFPDALVLGSETLEPHFAKTTAPKDTHVAAGALKLNNGVYAGQPVVLVTSNTHTCRKRSSQAPRSNRCGPGLSWSRCLPLSRKSPRYRRPCSRASPGPRSARKIS